MALTASPYNQLLAGLGSGAFNFNSDTLKALLVDATYSFDKANHLNVSHITGEITGTGYTAGGTTITGQVWSVGPMSATLTCDPIAWAAITASPRGAVVYKDSGTPATSPLIGFIDFGADKIRNAEPLELQATSGLIQILALS